MKILKRFSVFEIGLITVILGIHLYAALSDAYNMPNSWYTRDDAYYYFKVAQNISEGHGSTFDGINLTNGYHPLWMALCVPIFALARFDLILPLRVLVMVMAGFSAATAVLIYRLVKGTLTDSVAILAASFWAFNAYIHYIVYEFGLETPLAAFAIALLVYQLSKFERMWRKGPVATRLLVMLAGVATLALFSRLDLVFLAVFSGLWIVLRGHPMRSLLPLDIVIIFLSMTTSIALRTDIKSYNSIFAQSALDAVLVSLAVKLPALYALGAYRHPRAGGIGLTMRRCISGVALSVPIIAGGYLLLVRAGIGRNLPLSAFFIDGVISLLLILLCRLAAYRFSAKQGVEGAVSVSPWEELRVNWPRWSRESAVYFGVLGGALMLYMSLNQIWFGTATPVSGQIKRWWGTLGDTVYDNAAPNWASFFGIGFRGVYDAWQPVSNFFLSIAGQIKPMYPGSNTLDERYYIVMAATVAVSIVILLANPERTRNKVANMAAMPLMAAAATQILAYTTTAYGGTKEWYWVSQMILIVLVLSLLFDLVLRPLRKHRSLRMGLSYVSLLIGGYLALRLASEVRTVMPYQYFAADRPYMEVLPFLEANTPPGAVIGMTGGGNVGYFIHDRIIVNMDGLINSYGYFKSVQRREAPMYLHQRGLTIIFANPRLLSLPPYDGQFAAYLEGYSSYGGKSLLYLLEEPKY